MDVVVVAKLMGHSDPSVTLKKYAQLIRMPVLLTKHIPIFVIRWELSHDPHLIVFVTDEVIV